MGGVGGSTVFPDCEMSLSGTPQTVSSQPAVALLWGGFTSTTSYTDSCCTFKPITKPISGVSTPPHEEKPIKMFSQEAKLVSALN